MSRTYVPERVTLELTVGAFWTSTVGKLIILVAKIYRRLDKPETATCSPDGLMMFEPKAELILCMVFGS